VSEKQYQPVFCQYVHTDGRRCVSAFGHAGPHDVQPVTSASVQAIMRQEAALKPREATPLDGATVLAAVDDAIAQRRTTDAAVYGVVPQSDPAPAEVQRVPVEQDPETTPPAPVENTDPAATIPAPKAEPAKDETKVEAKYEKEAKD
jgi:hypothetical protein